MDLSLTCTFGLMFLIEQGSWKTTTDNLPLHHTLNLSKQIQLLQYAIQSGLVHNTTYISRHVRTAGYQNKTKTEYHNTANLFPRLNPICKCQVSPPECSLTYWTDAQCYMLHPTIHWGTVLHLVVSYKFSNPSTFFSWDVRFTKNEYLSGRSTHRPTGVRTVTCPAERINLFGVGTIPIRSGNVGGIRW